LPEGNAEIPDMALGLALTPDAQTDATFPSTQNNEGTLTMSEEKVLVFTLYRKNRRLYSYEWKRHTNAQELLPLLRKGIRLEVRDNRKNGKNITQQILFVILAHCQKHGQLLITQGELEQILMRDPNTELKQILMPDPNTTEAPQ
jgi:hypothetical protein